jgi:hypothetical protein
MYKVMTSVRFMFLWLVGGLVTVALATVVAAFSLLGLSLTTGIAYMVGGYSLRYILLALALLFMSLFGLIVGFITGAMQKGTMQQKYQADFRWWRVLSALGGGLGMFLSGVALNVPLQRMLLTWTLPGKQVILFYGALPIVLPLVVIALLQWFVLQRYVHGAWTWILANAVGGLVLYSLVVTTALTGGITLPLLLIAIVAPWIVSGFSMLWLFQFNTRSTWPDDFN